MIGLALSTFLGLILIAFGRRWQDAYRKSTAFLLWWNIAITALFVVVWFSGTVFIAGLGGLFSGAVGFLVGLTGGGVALSALMFLMTVMSVVQTLGVLFLNKALAVTSGDVYEWKKGTLVVGVVFFAMGLSRVFG